MRGLPRITVRGHPVQSGSSPLRKAPLRSIVVPWSTKRPCGPLAFRRATAGSRVQRKVRGVKRGQETIRCPVPFCPRRRAAALPTPCHGEYPPSREGLSRLHRLHRCIGGTAYPLLRVKKEGSCFRGAAKNLPVSREVLNIYVSNRISVFGAALSVQYGCRAAAS